jgi:hypothetical protein
MIGIKMPTKDAVKRMKPNQSMWPSLRRSGKRQVLGGDKVNRDITRATAQIGVFIPSIHPCIDVSANRDQSAFHDTNSRITPRSPPPTTGPATVPIAHAMPT